MANAASIADGPLPRNLSLQARRHAARLTADGENETRKFTNPKLKRAPTKHWIAGG
jgi:hypothetical protein